MFKFIRKGQDFPGGRVVRTLCFHCRGPGSVPGWGTKILEAAQPKKKEKKRPKCFLCHFASLPVIYEIFQLFNNLASGDNVNLYRLSHSAGCAVV